LNETLDIIFIAVDNLKAHAVEIFGIQLYQIAETDRLRVQIRDAIILLDVEAFTTTHASYRRSRFYLFFLSFGEEPLENLFAEDIVLSLLIIPDLVVEQVDLGFLIWSPATDI
jgi:hypothetical protein